MVASKYTFPDRENKNQGLVIDESDGMLKCIGADGSTVLWYSDGTTFTSALTHSIGNNLTVAGLTATSGVTATGGSFTGVLKNTSYATTLGAAATTFALSSSTHVVTGHGGANTIATITGGSAGVVLTLLFVDALVTITDTDAATASTINLKAPFVSTAGGSLQLIHNGTKWFEVGRSGCLPLEGGTLTGAVIVPAGTVAAPSVAIQDSNDGFYEVADGQIGVSIAGTNTATFAAGSLTSAQPVIVPAGTVAAPGLAISDANDGLYEVSDGVIGVSIAGAQVSQFAATGPSVTGANGSFLNIKTATAALTGLSGATATATTLIPAGSLVLGLSARVTTLIETSTSFDIGDGTDVYRFGDDVAVAANTTTTLANWTVTTPPIYAAATSVVLTANGGAFSAGAVRLALTYIDLTAPTS